MTFEWLVALRYLRSPNRPAVLRIVTLLAVMGVAAGVTTLVIALSMNTGFRQAIRDRLLSVTAHVNLKPIGTEGIRNYQQLSARLADTPGVRSIEPAIYATVLLSSGPHARGIVLKGVDPELERRASEALRKIDAGSSDFSADAEGIPALLVGRLLAADLRLSTGNYVTLTSPQGNLTPFGMLPRSRRFRVAGIFDSGFYDYDANWGFVNLQSAQGLAGIGDVVSLLEVRVTNMDDAAAIAETLSGKNNPAGRLPVTFYTGVDQLPHFENYSMEGRTYRYFKGTPLYPFGYGLSYTSFEYKDLNLPTNPVPAGAAMSASVTVSNRGRRAGDEVAQLYLSFPNVPGAPIRALRAFQRVHLDPGESQTLHFDLKPRDLSMVTDAGDPIVAAGQYKISIGGGQPDTGVPAVAGTFQIDGTVSLPE